MHGMDREEELTHEIAEEIKAQIANLGEDVSTGRSSGP